VLNSHSFGGSKMFQNPFDGGLLKSFVKRDNRPFSTLYPRQLHCPILTSFALAKPLIFGTFAGMGNAQVKT
jgi:hypothetical protein